MRDLKKMCDRELFREAWQRGLAYWRVSSLRGTACFPDDNVHNSIAEPLAVVANEAREAVIKRMKSRAQSHAWDGVGPKLDCLLLVKWADGGTEEWVHFAWKDDDASGYNDGEGEYSVTHEGYYNDASTISVTQSSDGWMGYTGKFDDVNGADFTILRWSDLPEVDDSEAES